MNQQKKPPMKSNRRTFRPWSLIGLALLASAIHLSAQTYVRTNMQVAATITNGTTYTYAGTNFIDAQRYGEVVLENRTHGNAASTNNVVWTFKLSADGTNYGDNAVFTWVARPGYDYTNITLGAMGFIKPYQRISTNAENLTNTLFGYLKGYRRD